MTEPTTPIQPPPALVPPSVNAGWAVAALLFFWPLSFSAFTHAFNVYPLWASGNVAGAQYASDRVRRLGQLSLWIFGGLLLLFAVLYAIFLVVLIIPWRRHVLPPRFRPRLSRRLTAGHCHLRAHQPAAQFDLDAGSACAARARSAEGL